MSAGRPDKSQAGLTTQLNMTRLVRSQIEPRLDRIENLLASIVAKTEMTSGGHDP